MYKAAIFDLDGTLVDSLPDIGHAANLALQDMGLPTFTTSEYKKIAGGGHWRLLTKAITLARGTPPTDEELEKAVIVKKAQEDGPNGHDRTKPYSGVYDALRTLQEEGIQLAILSNKGEPTVRTIVKKTFPDINFVHIAGQRDDTPMKPDPTAAIRITETYFDNVSPADVVFVGDTDIDMKTGMAAGYTPIAVPWGCRSGEELYSAGATVVIETAEDISNFLLNAPVSQVTTTGTF